MLSFYRDNDGGDCTSMAPGGNCNGVPGLDAELATLVADGDITSQEAVTLVSLHTKVRTALRLRADLQP